MNLRHGDSGTLDAGLLVRYLHGELDETGTQAVAAHAAACDACRSVVSALEADMRHATEALRTAAWEQPSPDEWQGVLERVVRTARDRQRKRRTRIAAGWILVAAAAGGLASAPVRAWIAERLAFVAEPALPAEPVQDRSAGRASVSFEPSGPELAITFAAKQTSGFLTLAFTDSAKTTMTVNGGGTEHLTWNADGIRIANVTGAHASYGITLSRGVERVVVRIGEAGTTLLERARAAGPPVEIELSSGSVRNDPGRDEQ